MLIYTRPKVKALKKTEPQIPPFICFLCVILAGGEVPCLAEIFAPPASSSIHESKIELWARALGWDITSDNLDEELDSHIKKKKRRIKWIYHLRKTISIYHMVILLSHGENNSERFEES